MAKCELCRSDRQDPVQYGEFLCENGKSVHTYCLYLSSSLTQNGADDEGILGFLMKDIQAERRRVSLLYCCYCGGNHANVGCCEVRCPRSFHMICGIENGALNEFFGSFNSYCDRHVRKSKCKPTAEELCCICYDKLFRNKKQVNTVNVIRAPCCRNGWFHKYCLQRFAYTAGYFFKCPLCNDSTVFKQEVPSYGIFIPQRDAAWELEPNAFAELLERPNECTAENCCNATRRGSSTDDDNPLLFCDTCGSVAIHKRCINSASSKFRCNSCKQLLSTDSGRESMHSLTAEESIEQEENEDEHIDVCADSDNSDAEENKWFEEKAICAIEEKEDSSEKSNMSHKQKRFYKHAQLLCDDDSSDMVDGPSTQMKSKDKRSEYAAEDDSSTDEDEVIKSKYHPKPLRVIVDSDLESLKNSATNTASYTAKQQIDESSDSDEDPLENFQIIMDRIQSKKCKAGNSGTLRHAHDDATSNKPIRDLPASSSDAALCSRRNVARSKSSTADICNQKLNSNSTRYQPFGSLTLTDNEKSPKTLVNRKRANSTESSSSGTQSSLEISCIARRTRRRSKFVINDENSSSSTDRRQIETEDHPLDVSCVAQRTRRKSVPLTLNTENCSSSTDRRQIETENHPLDVSSVAQCTRPSSTDRRQIETENNPLNVSCVAQRTRRKSVPLTLSTQQDDDSNASASKNAQKQKTCTATTSHSNKNNQHTDTRQASGSPTPAKRLRVARTDSSVGDSRSAASSSGTRRLARRSTLQQNNPLDVSCIAQRVRCKSMSQSTDTHTHQIHERTNSGGAQAAASSSCTRRLARLSKSQQNNPLDVSCIAQRTRCKSMSQSTDERSNSVNSRCDTDSLNEDYDENGFDEWHTAIKNAVNELATAGKNENANTTKSLVTSENHQIKSSVSCTTSSYPSSSSYASSSSSSYLSSSMATDSAPISEERASTTGKSCNISPSKDWFNHVRCRISGDGTENRSSLMSSTPRCNTLSYRGNVTVSSQHRSDPYIMPKFTRVAGKLKRVYNDDARQENSNTPVHHNFVRSYNLLLNASNKSNKHNRFRRQERRCQQQQQVLHSQSDSFKCL